MLVRETAVLAGGRDHAHLSPLSFLPCEKPYFYCPIVPPFSQGEGESRLAGMGHLILPQHYASVEKKKSDHEMGLKFSVYHGSRSPNWGLVAFCFQVKMLCTTEELTVK